MPTAADIDEKMMSRALAEASRGRPSPNPHVGAVIAKGDNVVAVGHHERAGSEHAEVAAIRAAGDSAKDSTLYVTLEPCNHQGRTPPCVDVILQSGISRVVIGCRDPNPNVDGGGVDVLQVAGLDVEIGVKAAEAQALIQPWVKHVTTGLPYVSLKLAVSLDGRIATRTGVSKWVAVMVGVGTVLADDPELTVREVEGPNPIRIAIDSKLRIPTTTELVTTASQIPTWVMTTQEAPEALESALVSQGVEVVRVPRSSEGRVDVTSALRALAQRGIIRVLIEGGAELAGSVLNARLADELHVFIGPMLLGPRGRPGAVDWAGPTNPAEAPRIADPDWEVCGRDAYVHGAVAYPAPK
ncbi:MAG: riboflavin biosynthesis protein RibD [Sorangium cellulosum]|nr:MAG: riboflavin biosynthesis protein RibD [Sorangium cellulosum]